ncbi:hypothetical protein [Rhodoglobus sp.]
MSGRTSKHKRQVARLRPERIINAEIIGRSADAVLSARIDDVPLSNRTTQVVVGLCRAAFAQDKVLAMLAEADQLSAGAPNRRLVLEVALRLHWLQGVPPSDRGIAVDTMLEKDRQDTNRLLDYLRDAGQEIDFDAAEMNTFVLENATKGKIHQEVTRLSAAVSSGEVKAWSTYSMWLAETPFSHASANLAGKYAPSDDNRRMSRGVPDPADEDLKAHRLIQLQIIMATGFLLSDEDVPDEFAGRFAKAFFAA